ncbi:ANTAR domain-containing protein [Jatrophihabitans endophyticus]|uniref:ANTAR domain-containing protein n=1 Tax=Jatrophihabitans endophyticus TaxID=1206085 RepID=UPI001A0DB51E|nr:ANTAR domain-containing protein [Jatrophihabitans endophyticus]MBE7187161.1 ANTAR domain-containing protein [Jatrophihabitans endophyticus]
MWLAVGVVMNMLRMDAVDALARLRAHAYGLGDTLDDVASRIIDDPETAGGLAD